MYVTQYLESSVEAPSLRIETGSWFSVVMAKSDGATVIGNRFPVGEWPQI